MANFIVTIMEDRSGLTGDRSITIWVLSLSFHASFPKAQGILITLQGNITAMSCYLRRLDDVVKAAGVKLGPENRKEVDRTIKELLGLSYCPDVWIEVKKRLAVDEHGFIADLHDAFLTKGLL